MDEAGIEEGTAFAAAAPLEIEIVDGAGFHFRQGQGRDGAGGKAAGSRPMKLDIAPRPVGPPRPGIRRAAAPEPDRPERKPKAPQSD